MTKEQREKAIRTFEGKLGLAKKAGPKGKKAAKYLRTQLRYHRGKIGG